MGLPIDFTGARQRESHELAPCHSASDWQSWAVGWGSELCREQEMVLHPASETEWALHGFTSPEHSHASFLVLLIKGIAWTGDDAIRNSQNRTKAGNVMEQLGHLRLKPKRFQQKSSPTLQTHLPLGRSRQPGGGGNV